jgi:hypothetical protein
MSLVMFEIGFQFGYGCFVCYLFGVAYTLSEANYNTGISFLKPTKPSFTIV